MESFGLFPVNFKYPTHFSTTCNTLLDELFVSDCKKIQNYDQISLPAFSKHDLIIFTYNINIDYNDCYIEYRDFVNIDYALLSADLDSCDWNSLYCTAEVNTQLEILQRKVKIHYDRTVPLKRNMCKHRAKSWFNYSIENLIQKRDKSYAKWNRCKTENFYNEFKSNRKLVNKAIAEAKRNYYIHKFKKQEKYMFSFKGILQSTVPEFTNNNYLTSLESCDRNNSDIIFSFN